MKEINKNFKLDDLPKRNIYQVPESYFDRLPMRVMERTAGAHTEGYTWLPALWKAARLTVAPLVLLLVFVGVYFFNIQAIKDQPESLALSSIAETEIIEYLTNYTNLQTADFSELALAEQEFTADFLNISSQSAEEELEYYQLQDLTL